MEIVNKAAKKMINNEKTNTTSNKVTAVTLLILQIIIIIFYVVFVDYDDLSTIHERELHASQFEGSYPLYMDMHVMIFIGFGFLMTFLRRYAYSALGFTLLIASISIQIVILFTGGFDYEEGKIHIRLESLVTASAGAAAVLISFGAVLGKISPLQLTIMAIIETFLFAANKYLGVTEYQVVDAGGSMFVHTFGAYFGLAVSLILQKRNEGHALESSSYSSDVTSMIGSLFLWVFWPSFNAIDVFREARMRAVFNTYLAMCACTITTFCFSSLFHSAGKYKMEHVQNATLAGGVCIGAAADLIFAPALALTIGAVAGILSTLGYLFLQGFLLARMKLHDTCGVHNLHGMPGVLAGLIAAAMAGLADEKQFGFGLYLTFPARAPANDTPAYNELNNLNVTIPPGDSRPALLQAGYQLIALATTLVIAVIGGLITGCIVRFCSNDRRVPGSCFDDARYWDIEEPLPETEISPPKKLHSTEDVTTTTTQTMPALYVPLFRKGLGRKRYEFANEAQEVNFQSK